MELPTAKKPVEKIKTPDIVRRFHAILTGIQYSTRGCNVKVGKLRNPTPRRRTPSLRPIQDGELPMRHVGLGEFDKTVMPNFGICRISAPAISA
jgi:hypothetical protein